MKPSLKIGVLIALCASPSAAAEGQPSPVGELLDPGWNDPFFSDYLKRESAKPLAARQSEPGTIEFSLPVLGFSPSGDPGGAKVLSAPMGSRFAAVIPTWPRCAKNVPDTVTVPDAPNKSAGLPIGSWYTSTYDFGCIQIVVEGNRNSPDPALVPDKPSIPESGDIILSYSDENAGIAMDAEGNALPVATGAEEVESPVSISYTRGNLTYDITVSCQPEALFFCANAGGLHALVGQLVTVDGHPEPR